MAKPAQKYVSKINHQNSSCASIVWLFMNLEKRIIAFSQLGAHLDKLSPGTLDALSIEVIRENPWFTFENVASAIHGVTRFLAKESLLKWTSSYHLHPALPKSIGVSMAGNIPLVGFHDFLCVLISGHRLKARLSSQDSILMMHVANKLIELEPAFRNVIQWEHKLNQVDALIATGSDNTARYFEYYFRNIPHLIRKNRSSCAVISGTESHAELTALGTDVFRYFGLGCRNVSKLFVPIAYDFANLFHSWEKHRNTIDHSKYANNYGYQKSISRVNKTPFFDNGYVLLQEATALVSPIAVLYFEYYVNQNDLQQKIDVHREKLQCIVSAKGLLRGSDAFGETQFPGVADYADKVDTLRFLSEV